MMTDTMIIIDAHPGDIIKEHMDELGWSQRELAQRLGVHPKSVNLLIHHKTRIDRDYAEAFSRIFGHSADFWLNLETVWADNEQLKKAEGNAKKQRSELSKYKYSELVKANLIKDSMYYLDKVNSFLGFFRVANFDALNGIVASNANLYKRRCAKSATDKTLAVWVMACERVSENAHVYADYSKDAFSSALREIRQTMLIGSIDIDALKDMCAKAGVAVVAIPPFKGLGVCGASFWHKKKPVIALAWNYSDDRFWFYFFHEAAHILSDPPKEVFAEIQTRAISDDAEQRANAFSENMLLPEFDAQEFASAAENKILEYAENNNVMPGIVVGRLKNRGILNAGDYMHLIQKTPPKYDSLV